MPFPVLTSVTIAAKGESCSASNGLPINLHMQVRGAAFTPQNNTADDELSPQDKNLVSDSQRLHLLVLTSLGQLRPEFLTSIPHP